MDTLASLQPEGETPSALAAANTFSAAAVGLEPGAAPVAPPPPLAASPEPPPLAVASTAAMFAREPIPGYVLREKLGAGGYGEVWLADAPGGLLKAVKIVFGHVDSVRAERELKSLQKIRQVNHPFLLSLERVEIVNNQLVIVSELAEGSLKDQFEEYRQQDLPGIPREELLDRMRDAADALDFLYDKHGLQHLDVKPENLLMVGGHVKVADFGMVKEVSARDASLVNGLTPLYASPELFDGRPNRYSDQYSLAIVYQEMLTGEPPFSGRTAAQLASQHLNAKPALAGLPVCDQPVIARALSKDPERRFPSCRALVEALVQAPKTVPSTLRRMGTLELGKANGEAGETPMKSDSLARPNRTEPTSLLSGRRRNITELPPIEGADAATAYRPTLYIGLGSLGRRVLERVQERLAEQLGSADPPPTHRFLILDTDRSELAALRSGGSGMQTVYLPLKSTADYRARSDSLLEWLSRRWLYNIPRSLKTEGIRPLGRLAWIDHFEETAAQVKHEVLQAVSPEALAASEGAFRTRFRREQPRVMIVGSLNGGTCSGIAADMLYLVRSLLREQRLGDHGVCAFLLHCLPRKASARDLAIANACAALSEFNHFLDPERGYPGEPACGLPAFRGDLAGVPGLYLVQCPCDENAAEDETEKTLKQVGEYLYLASATKAAAYFDACRAQGTSQSPEGTVARTLGLCRNNDDVDFAPLAVEFLQRAWAETWAQGGELADHVWSPLTSGCAAVSAPPRFDGHHVTADLKLRLEQRLAQLGVGLEPLVANALRLVQTTLGCTPDKYFAELVRRQAATKGATPPARRTSNSVCDTIDQLTLGDADGKSGGGNVESLLAVAERHLQTLMVKAADDLRGWFASLVDDRARRVLGAGAAAEWLRVHLESLGANLNDALSSLASEAAERRHSPIPLTPPQLVEYALVRTSEAVHRATLNAVRTLLQRTRENLEVLRELAKRLLALPEAAVPRGTGDDNQPGRWRPRDLARASNLLNSHLAEMLAGMNDEFDSLLKKDSLSFQLLLGGTADVRRQLSAQLRKAAENVVKQVRAKLAQGTTQAVDLETLVEPQVLRDLAQQAAPALLQCGGARRLIVVAPLEFAPHEKLLATLIQKVLGDEPTLVFEHCLELTLCYEIEQVPLENVAALLSSNRRQYHDLAERLQTRIDVKWKPFLAWNSNA